MDIRKVKKLMELLEESGMASGRGLEALTEVTDHRAHADR